MLNFLSKFGLNPCKNRHAVLKTAFPPKPRAEGSSPSAPARNTGIAFAVPVFFCFFSKEKTPGSTGGNKKL